MVIGVNGRTAERFAYLLQQSVRTLRCHGGSPPCCRHARSVSVVSVAHKIMTVSWGPSHPLMERLRNQSDSIEDICTRRHTISRGATRFHTTAQITSGSNNDSVILVGWILEKRLGGSVSVTVFVLARRTVSRGAQPSDFLGCQLPPMPQLQFAVAEGSDGDALQLGDGMADGVTHLAHLTVAPFTDCDLEKRAGVALAPARVQGRGRARGSTIERPVFARVALWTVALKTVATALSPLRTVRRRRSQSACEPGEGRRVGDAEHRALRPGRRRGADVSRAARSPSLINSSPRIEVGAAGRSTCSRTPRRRSMTVGRFSGSDRRHVSAGLVQRQMPVLLRTDAAAATRISSCATSARSQFANIGAVTRRARRASAARSRLEAIPACDKIFCRVPC